MILLVLIPNHAYGTVATNMVVQTMHTPGISIVYLSSGIAL